MNWIRQIFCSHDIVSTEEHEVTRREQVGGYIYAIERYVSTIYCKKCGYTKKIVS